MSYNVYGIRHHGPGSAHSLVEALKAYQPDCVLIEGPPEADGLLDLAAHAEMEPPVALLAYAPEDTNHTAFYPFATFSPEWQAIQYAAQHELPCRFIDLPMAVSFALVQARKDSEKNAEREGEDEGEGESGGGGEGDVETQKASPDKEAKPETPEALPHQEGALEKLAPPNPLADMWAVFHDPLQVIAEAAGYDDGERWWEDMVEERTQDDAEVFEAIAEVMTSVREAVDNLEELKQTVIDAGVMSDEVPLELTRELLREAHMRKQIRQAVKTHTRVAVVCGAWHVPALQTMPAAKHDNALLKGLPKIKTVATWVPWTYSRLAYVSGYGAGVKSPGWYHHLWERHEHTSAHWLAKIAQALRHQGKDVSSAHIIEAVRLAETLAVLRGRPLAGPNELHEAVFTVMLFGDDALMGLVRQEVMIGERMGTVPTETPMAPLQQDLKREQKRLRFKPSAVSKTVILDLRKENDLARSQLLRRLRLLGVAWGVGGERGGGKGTFKEEWEVQWEPELELKLIEASIWGHTISQAAHACVIGTAKETQSLTVIVKLAQDALYADLEPAVTVLMQRLQDVAAVASDVVHLMEALPGLAQLLRYGDVRKTSTEPLEVVAASLVTRICVGLGHACSSLNADASKLMYGKIHDVHSALDLLNHAPWKAEWLTSLKALAQQDNVHPLLTGTCFRLLYDSQAINSEEIAPVLSRALSAAVSPEDAAAWAEGFLHGSGQILIYEIELWTLLDQWVTGLTDEHFQQLLPLLRRTFSNFAAGERRQIGERVSGQAVAVVSADAVASFNTARAAQVLPTVRQLLGLGGRS